MFYRNILNVLKKWKFSGGRKPLILRGARQTGKTVAVRMFGESFSHVVSLNLEREADRRLFEGSDGLEQAMQAIELARGSSLREKDTLLFIDEIQNSPKAIRLLRYFYEDVPELAVVGAGSLLEAVMFSEGFSFPVGRVQFAYLYPATFDEFLGALGEDRLLEALRAVSLETPPSVTLHDLALKRFHQYLLVGGMPEAVATFAETESLQTLVPIMEGLVTSFEEDVPKYSRPSEAVYLKCLLQNAPLAIGERITYENFAKSGYRSREMRRAFDLLEYAMLLQRVRGAAQTTPPPKPNRKVSPKLLFLDVGLAAYQRGLREDALFVKDLNDLFRGALAEQVVGQSFMAMKLEERIAPLFWYRNKPGSTAEVDYLFPFQDRLIPVEVKSGKSGKLKSLQQFFRAAPHDLAVRLYSGPLCEEPLRCGDRSARLFSVPLYLQWRLHEILGEQGARDTGSEGQNIEWAR